MNYPNSPPPAEEENWDTRLIKTDTLINQDDMNNLRNISK